MTDMLIERLEAAASAVPLPDADEFAASVLARLADSSPAGGSQSTRPSWGRRAETTHRWWSAGGHGTRARVGVAIAAAMAIAVVLLPGPRHAVSRWFGLDAVRIERVPAPVDSGIGVEPATDATATDATATDTTATGATATDAAGTGSTAPDQPVPTMAGDDGPSLVAALGPAVTPAAVAATGLPLPTPAALGDVVSLHLPATAGLVQAVAVYAPSDDLPASPVTGVGAVVVVAEARADAAIFGKMAPPGTTIETFVIDGEPAIWLEGELHEFFVLVGDEPVADTARLATNTLLWQRGDVLFRLEATISRAEAERIARSWEPVTP